MPFAEEYEDMNKRELLAAITRLEKVFQVTERNINTA